MNDFVSQFEQHCVDAVKHWLANGFYFSKNKELGDKLLRDDTLTKGELMVCVSIFYDTIGRIPKAVKRSVKECSGISCPTELLTGYEALKRELEFGANLLPRLSRKAKDLDYHDSMFDDWGIIHFHLGNSADINNPGLVQGTEKIAYVYFAPYEDVAYIIAINSHGHWADVELLKKLDDDYPDALSTWCIKGVSDISINAIGSDRVALRSSHVNACTKINGKVIISPWGGVMTNGERCHSYLQAMHSYRFIRWLSDNIGLLLIPLKLSASEVDSLELVSFRSGSNWFACLRIPACNKYIVVNERRVVVGTDLKTIM